MIAFFFAGWPVAEVALAAGALLLITPCVGPEIVYREIAWLVLAMSSTLAGNLTVLGSVANLIVVERARRETDISFWEYAKAGIPVTLVTLAIGVALL